MKLFFRTFFFLSLPALGFSSGIFNPGSGSGGGGGGASSLAVNQNGVQITSPTVAINALAPPFIVTSVGGGTTAQWALDGSSVTMRGQAWSNNVDASTNTITTRLIAVGVSTAAIAVDTGTINTALSTKVNYSSFSATLPITYNSATGSIGATQISLSTGAMNVLPSGLMVSSSAFTSSSQTYSGAPTFVSSVTFLGAQVVSSTTLLNLSPGSTQQVYTSAGPGLGAYWSTQTGGGGSGIVSPGTFTWTNNFGVSLSTLNVTGSANGVNIVQVSTNNTSSYALSISSVGYTTFQPMSTSSNSFVIQSTQGVPVISVDNSAVSNTDFVLRIASGDVNATTIFGVQNNSHVVSSGTIPSVSSCGTNPSVVGTDMEGVVTIGSGIPTSCTLSFALPYVNNPVCVISDNSTAITGDISSVSTTAVTFSFSASLGGGQVYYICLGNRG